ncbi:DUF2145 domain-containing protein [endosymbiont of Ridgeia piscesae]|uniref:DUF2145 domain-containing protein n=1 Tax=endosymbiont of Ridgeia piscesae TaxID=54398 RepID=A0A0T5YV91_9GAMM|nr:DUF2145 domain-containing protein [endosymbiont of Ridgeia piscesae]KRT54504.1 Uncharacterized protein Ga0074115_10730 [endosymbiont of Ridgeia piscesae]KRT57862.1 hypothetical protein Ga0076813_12453 [endosymbiont of Ridgeia piscesae]
MRTLRVFLMLLLLSVSGLSIAGSGSGAEGAELRFDPVQTARLAKQVEYLAAERGARVIILGRVGRPADQLPEGVEFTHVAFAVYSQITTDEGVQLPGYVVYNLYQRADQPDVSDLVRDYPADFFVAVEQLKAGIIIPTPEMQRRLLQVIASESYSKLHNPAYSVSANPYNSQFQSCTEHTLDVLNAALYQTDDVAQIKANNRAYFKAQRLSVAPLKLMLGALLMPDLSLQDHQGPLQTATFSTIAAYMEKYGLADEVIRLGM